MNILKEFTLNDTCSYIKDNDTLTHYQIINNSTTQNCQELIERGYRRFGKMFFRPICTDCNECQSIKIDVNNFVFTKSHKRVIRKASHITNYIQTPTLTQDHMNLFKKYHLHMKDKKDWDYQETSPEHYYNSFVNGHEDFGYEVLYYDKERLIAVDLIDILDDGISSIYFYYDPDYEKLSLGKLSLLNQIKFAKGYQRKWIYLGYYVEQCPSLSYKSYYTPYITLEGRPNMQENYQWS